LFAITIKFSDQHCYGQKQCLVPQRQGTTTTKANKGKHTLFIFCHSFIYCFVDYQCQTAKQGTPVSIPFSFSMML